MSHDEKTSRAFDGLMTAMRTNELHESIKILARQVAELRGVDFDTEGDQIIQDALQQGHDDYHQRVAQKSFELTKKLLHSDEPSEVPSSPQYEYLKAHGEKFHPESDPQHPFKQPDVPEGFRLYEVYDSNGRFSPMCVDVTDPEQWRYVCENGYENWGGRLDSILISEEELAKYPGPGRL